MGLIGMLFGCVAWRQREATSVAQVKRNEREGLPHVFDTQTHLSDHPFTVIDTYRRAGSLLRTPYGQVLQQGLPGLAIV